MIMIADHQQRDRAWLSQLHTDHESICWQYGVDLSTPLIEISRSERQWGSWHPATKTIRLAARLIRDHSWDVVTSVFKHEMAHQLVTEHFGDRDGHGPLFARACEMLGVPEQFRGASGDIPRTLPALDDGPQEGRERALIDKTEKLLALARSDNEHEAVLAMAKANELIEKYNLRRIEGRQQTDYEYLIINPGRKRIENFQRKICFILINFYYVKVIFSRLYDARACCHYKTIEIFGSRENVLIAHYVYSFLERKMHSLWKDHQRLHNLPGKGKRSFLLGLLDGFAEKLSTMKKQRQAKTADPARKTQTTALIRAEDRRLDEYIGRRHPRLRTKKPPRTRIHPDEYQAGQHQGRQLTLHKGVNDNLGSSGKMLPE